MTTTRYICSTSFSGIHSDNWGSFIDGLQNSCTFTLKDLDNHSTFKQIPIWCEFTARYYTCDGMVHYHITNDTRRKLTKILFKGVSFSG
jgi:hypothetical protein